MDSRGEHEIEDQLPFAAPKTATISRRRGVISSMTNWNKLTLAGTIALAAMMAPTALAQRSGGERRGGGEGMRGSAGMSQMRMVDSGSRVARPHRSGGFHRGGEWRHRHGGHWRHRHGGRHHRHYYPRRHVGFYPGFYPYGFGYPYGYGYPYFGASAALYYHGYRPVYQGRAVQSVQSVEVAVQQQLAAAGYYRGAIDGIIGGGTRAAIRAYQRANRLPVTGRIDARLLARMGLR